eukprot:503320-Prymnesium_polylepis.1
MSWVWRMQGGRECSGRATAGDACAVSGLEVRLASPWDGRPGDHLCTVGWLVWFGLVVVGRSGVDCGTLIPVVCLVTSVRCGSGVPFGLPRLVRSGRWPKRKTPGGRQV